MGALEDTTEAFTELCSSTAEEMESEMGRATIVFKYFVRLNSVQPGFLTRFHRKAKANFFPKTQVKHFGRQLYKISHAKNN